MVDFVTLREHCDTIRRLVFDPKIWQLPVVSRQGSRNRNLELVDKEDASWLVGRAVGRLVGRPTYRKHARALVVY